MNSIPGSGRFPREGNGNPLQYSCWRNPWTEATGRLHSIGSQGVGIRLKRLSMFDRGWSTTLKNRITHGNTIMETELRLISMYIKNFKNSFTILTPFKYILIIGESARNKTRIKEIRTTSWGMKTEWNDGGGQLSHFLPPWSMEWQCSRRENGGR